MQTKADIRYSRHHSLPGFGREKQEMLGKSKVLVIGAGGLGCPVLQYLTAAGIGTIGIVDGDTVELSNLQRQVLFGEADIGRPKAQVAMEKLQGQNPDIEIHCHEVFITAENALEIFKEYDVIVDGTDNFTSRYLINDAAVLTGKPVVFGSILGFEGQVSVFNWGDKGPTYRCLFPEAPDPLDSPSCSELGVIGVLPGMIGTLQANEVIKLCTGIGEPLSGKLLIWNALNTSQNLISFFQNPENKRITQLKEESYDCEINDEERTISIEAFLAHEAYWKTRMVDVRSESEYGAFNKGGVNIPLQSIAQNVKKLKAQDKVLLVCQSGKRSEQALNYLLEQGLDHVVHLEGGWNTLG
ncbi:molybdopterin-synthase adenylyltransferase MoeB [Echinicola sediminis]